MLATLTASGIVCEVFDSGPTGPVSHAVAVQGAAQMASFKPDSVVALGGGSVMGAAKVCALKPSRFIPISYSDALAALARLSGYATPLRSPLCKGRRPRVALLGQLPRISSLSLLPHLCLVCCCRTSRAASTRPSARCAAATRVLMCVPTSPFWCASPRRPAQVPTRRHSPSLRATQRRRWPASWSLTT